MTPLGKFLRDKRIEKGLLLKDLCDCLGVKPAYLSAIEHGKKGKPGNELLQNIADCMSLNVDDRNHMMVVAEISETKFSIPPKAIPSAYETANMFARKLPSLSEEQLKKIRKVINE